MYNLEESVMQSSVTKIEPLPDGKFKLYLSRGQPIVTSYIIYAANVSTKNIPEWVRFPAKKRFKKF